MRYSAVIIYCFIVLCTWSVTNADILTGLGENLFGHKCSYFWRHPNISVNANYLMDVTNKHGDQCKAIQLNYISRHGARYPSTDDLNYIDMLKDKVLKHYAKLSQFPFITNWHNYPPKEHARLEDLGRWELHYLGNIYGKGLYNLFSGNISPSTIKLTATDKMRTQTSSKEFYKALTEVVVGRGLTDISPVINDTMLRYFDNCPNYDLSVLHNTTQMYQQYAYQNSSFFQEVVENVSRRLGMNVSLTVDDIKMMMKLCATDLAVRNSTDWCSLQTEEEREVVNYESDLEDYYSFHHPIIQKITCPLWEDIFASLENAINNYEANHTDIDKKGSYDMPSGDIHFKNQARATHFGSFAFDRAGYCSSFAFAKATNVMVVVSPGKDHVLTDTYAYVVGDLRFGHADTMNTFYSTLGLFHDTQALRFDNFLTMRNRLFYGSKVTTFSAHIAFILYNCGGKGHHNYSLVMMVNGQQMIIPGCDSLVCTYLDVRHKYRNYIEQCHWKDLCNIHITPVG